MVDEHILEVQDCVESATHRTSMLVEGKDGRYEHSGEDRGEVGSPIEVKHISPLRGKKRARKMEGDGDSKDIKESHTYTSDVVTVLLRAMKDVGYGDRII